MTIDETTALKEVLRLLDSFLLGDVSLSCLSQARALLRLALASGEAGSAPVQDLADELSQG